MHTKKTRTTITINKKLLEKAKKMDISISSFLDIKLREYIAILEGNNIQKNYLSYKQKAENADAGNRTRAEGLEGPNHSL